MPAVAKETRKFIDSLQSTLNITLETILKAVTLY